MEEFYVVAPAQALDKPVNSFEDAWAAHSDTLPARLERRRASWRDAGLESADMSSQPSSEMPGRPAATEPNYSPDPSALIVRAGELAPCRPQRRCSTLGLWMFDDGTCSSRSSSSASART
jgi:hypothetical protein